MSELDRAWFEQLCADLAAGDQDLIDHIAWLQSIKYPPELHLLDSSLITKQNRGQLPSLAPIRSIAPPIVEYLSRIGSEELLLAYRSQFSEAFCEEMALAYEKLQANTFNDMAAPTLDWKIHDRHAGSHPRRKLNSFRMSERIRNEQGTERMDSPPTVSGRLKTSFIWNEISRTTTSRISYSSVSC